MKQWFYLFQLGLSLVLVSCNGVSMLSSSNQVQKQNPNSVPRSLEVGSLSRRYRLTLRGQFVPITSSGPVISTINNNITASEEPGATTLFRPNDTATSLSPEAEEEKMADAGVDSAPSAEKISFVAWPLRRRPASRKFRPLVPSSTTRRPLVKLIRPRPTRPAMYSLDGFVPRPSLKKILTTTEPPVDRSFRGKFDLQALDSVQKKRKIKFRNDVGSRPEERKKFGGRDQHRKKRPVTRHNAFPRVGVAGKDFPILGSVPLTDFRCPDKSGMFADHNAGCQAWHLCGGGRSAHKHSFLCPNGTIFSESKGVCDWWYNVDCSANA